MPLDHPGARGTAVNDLPSQPDSPSDATAAAERTLSRVQGKVVSARAVLLRLLQEVVVAEARLTHSRAEQVVEANEQLVVSALLSQAMRRPPGGR